MSTRTARWTAHTTPGIPPPPPSRHLPGPVPTIYPESSVSNPYASRYTGRPSRPSSSYHHSTHSHSHSRTRSASAAPPPSYHPSHLRHGTSPSSHHYGYDYPTPPSHHSAASSPRSSPVPMQVHYAPPAEPVIARTSGADGRTSSYMIIPPKGQKVEILHPTPSRSNSLPPYHTSYTPHKDRPLIKRIFDKVEWADSRSSAASSSRTAASRSRRNSTGSAGGHTASGTRITSTSGRIYDVYHV